MYKKLYLVALLIFLLPFFKAQQSPQGHKYTSVQVQTSMFDSFQKNFYFGTPEQQLSLSLDTGSDLLWVPSVNCNKCERYLFQITKFDQNASTTYKKQSDKNITVEYGDGGGVEGFLVTDILRFDKFSINYTFLLGQKEKSNRHHRADGLIGLGNDPGTPNIFDIAYEEKKLISPYFGIKIGINFLNQNSYLHYNLSLDEFPDTYQTYALANKWKVPIAEFTISFFNYSEFNSALVDSGTSDLCFTPKLYNRIFRNNFKEYCTSSDENGIFCDCNYENYDDFIISIGNSFNSKKFKITPHSYLREYQGKCYLRISSCQDVCILGDPFFSGRTVLFDKLKKRVLFGPEQVQITDFVKFGGVIFVMNIMQFVFVLIGVVLVLKPKYQGVGKKIDSGTEIEIKGN